MALVIYDSDQNAYASLTAQGTEDGRQGPARTVHDGQLGGAHEFKVYVRNNDPANYYTNMILSYENNVYKDTGALGESGWSVKYLYGERRPTEAEWDEVRAGEPLILPDIGSTLAADTYTLHPIWIRVYCPGGSAAQIRTNQLVRISYFEKKVGA